MTETHTTRIARHTAEVFLVDLANWSAVDPALVDSSPGASSPAAPSGR